MRPRMPHPRASLLTRLVAFLGLWLGLIAPGAARAQDAASEPDDGVEVVLCFSGGGTRAAAFALGAARGLSEVPAGGASLLERVDRVVGVSGGSLTAAQVALDHSPAALDRFEAEVLRVDLERAMVRAAAADSLALAFRDLTRSDVAAGCFAARLGGPLTFADLPERPELLVQTTDVAANQPLLLSRRALPGLGLAPSELPLARALAASAAFPGIFPPVRLEPVRPEPALQEPALQEPALQEPARLEPARQESAEGEEAPTARYLADGGILDNLGLEPALALEPAPGTRALVLVVVNARCGLAIEPGALTSSWRVGLHAIEMQQRRIDGLLLARAREHLRALELAARLEGRALRTELVLIDFQGSERRAELDAIGTRFALSEPEVTLLLEEGRAQARARAEGAAGCWGQ